MLVGSPNVPQMIRIGRLAATVQTAESYGQVISLKKLNIFFSIEPTDQIAKPISKPDGSNDAI